MDFWQILKEAAAPLRTAFWLGIGSAALLLLSLVFSAMGFETDAVLFLVTGLLLCNALGVWLIRYRIRERRERRK